MSDPTPLSTDQRNLPKLLREAERRVNAHVFRTGGDDALASIPANPDRDVDLLLMEAAREIERLDIDNRVLAATAADNINHAHELQTQLLNLQMRVAR